MYMYNIIGNNNTNSNNSKIDNIDVNSYDITESTYILIKNLRL